MPNAYILRHSVRRSGAALIALASIACLPGLAAAEPERPITVAGMVYDVAIERPIGIVETAVGVAVAGVAYPLSVGSGHSEQVIERCVRAPARDTFARAIGRFEDRPRGLCSPVGFSWALVRMSFGVVQRPLGMLFGRSPFDDDVPDAPREEIEVDVQLPRAPSAPGEADGLEV